MTPSETLEEISSNLLHTNPLGYKHIIEPRNSLVIFLETCQLKLKTLLKRQHLDINLPRGVVVLTIIISLSVILTDQKKSWYERVKDLAPIVGVGSTLLYAMSNAHAAYHYKKREKSSSYINEWCSERMLEHQVVIGNMFRQVFDAKHESRFNALLFNRCHSRAVELKRSPDGIQKLESIQTEILFRILKKENAREKQAVNAALVLFEHMGQDVKERVADSEYLKDFFYGLLLSYYEFLRKYIEYLQYCNSCRVRFCNFVYLAQTWEKEGDLPELPRICYRPLVITSADISEARAIEESIKEDPTVSSKSDQEFF